MLWWWQRRATKQNKNNKEDYLKEKNKKKYTKNSCWNISEEGKQKLKEYEKKIQKKLVSN